VLAATAFAAAASVLTACAGSGLGVAARIGERRITAEEVRDYVDRGFATGEVQRGYDRSAAQSDWVAQLVKYEVYREAARRLDVTPSKEQLDKLVGEFIEARGGRQAVEQEAATQGIAARDLRPVLEVIVLREVVADALVRDKETPEAQLRAEYAKRLPDLDRARLAHIKVTDKALADKIVGQLKGGADFAKLAAEHSTDARSAPTGGDLGVIGNGPGQYDPLIVSSVFQSKTGALLGPIKVRDGFEIVKVVERRTVSFEEARGVLRQSLLAEERTKRLEAYVADLVKDMGLSINPRYGHWDEKAQGVRPGNDVLSSPAPFGNAQVAQPGQVPGQPGQ
jgi:parvulin-like peptidyl-prolyl isomerase